MSSCVMYIRTKSISVWDLWIDAFMQITFSLLRFTSDRGDKLTWRDEFRTSWVKELL